jgi:hypothetical protein
MRQQWLLPAVLECQHLLADMWHHLTIRCLLRNAMFLGLRHEGRIVQHAYTSFMWHLAELCRPFSNILTTYGTHFLLLLHTGYPHSPIPCGQVPWSEYCWHPWRKGTFVLRMFCTWQYTQRPYTKPSSQHYSTPAYAALASSVQVREGSHEPQIQDPTHQQEHGT